MGADAGRGHDLCTAFADDFSVLGFSADHGDVQRLPDHEPFEDEFAVLVLHQHI